MKMNYKKLWMLFLTIFWMCLIFAFSATPGEESAELSGGIVRKLARLFFYGSEKETLAAAEFIIRKSAHFLIYMILGIFVSLLLKEYKLKEKKRISLTVLWNFLYAVTDEIHQLFVPGRSGEVRDILIDTVGACIGILIVVSAQKFFRIRAEKRLTK